MGLKLFQLAVVIINYKTPHLVIDCLRSLVPEMNGLMSKIIVVDNHSQDKSLSEIQSWIINNNLTSLVSLIASSENIGFSGGNNLGIDQVKAKYYLLLNSDTILRAGAVNEMLETAMKSQDVGLVSPRLEWPDGTPQESCFRFHTPISELISSADTGFITKVFQKFVVAQVVCEENDYYDWTSFACVLVNASVLKDIGNMDDCYFLYFEDVEFCYRARRAGWKILNIPNAHVVHLRGGSSPVKLKTKLCKRLPRYLYESRTRYFYQLYGHAGLLAANLLWMLGFCISLLRSILSLSFSHKIPKHKWRDIWTNFLNPLAAYIDPDNYDKT